MIPPESIALRAGPVEASLEAGTLRNVRLFGVEILSSVFASVRDASWGTIEPDFTQYDVMTGNGSFAVQLGASCLRRSDGVDITWHATVIGRPDGTISFAFDAIVNRPFLRARIGLCVLHPLRLVGSPLEVDTPWGQVRGRFPDLVTAHLPFSNISGLRQDLGRASEVSLEFAGDLFQLEDQRAFGDASFKTFCTPLELPWPVMVDAGTRIQQAIHIRPSQAISVDEEPGRRRAGPRELDGHETARPTVVVGRRIGRRPLIGTHLPPAGVALDPPVLDALRRLRLDHLRMVVDAGNAADDAENEVARGYELAADLDLPLELAIVSRPGDGSMARILGAAARGPARLARLAVFDSQRHTTPEALLADARSAAAALGLDVALAGGSRGYLYQLVLNGVPAGIDVVEFPLTPQVHAFDDASILGTIASIGAAIRTADSLGGGSPIHVAPLSMRPQFNPDLVESDAVTDALLPASYDPRQADLLTAVWTLGCFAAIGAARGAGITAHEAAGWGGLVSAVHRDLPPAPGQPGTPFAVGALVAAVTELGPTAQIRAIRASPGIVALALESPSGRRLLLASTAQSPASLRIRLPLAWAADQPQAASLARDSRGEWAWLPAAAVRTSKDVELVVPARGIVKLD